VTLAEIPYPRIDPVIVRLPWFNHFGIRWYGVAYILAFALAWRVMRSLARRGRFPVRPELVGDFLFWGILGVFLGGRLGYVAFYAEDKSIGTWYRTWEGGMAFHGGLAGVILAYWIYAWRKKIPFRWLADGLALATPLGIFVVRLANFVNAELVGRVWNGPWAMQFPKYKTESPTWDGTWETDAFGAPVYRHPSQLYQALCEGLATYFILRWLMLRRRWGGGMVASAFLITYGVFRFVMEFFREPDKQIGYEWFGWMTRGQEFCLLMIVVGVGFLLWMRRGGKPMPAVEGVPPPLEPPLVPAR
jgi:phosphatidylglycerol:prolipoprotein diacylglycerol transferase